MIDQSSQKTQKHVPTTPKTCAADTAVFICKLIHLQAHKISKKVSFKFRSKHKLINVLQLYSNSNQLRLANMRAKVITNQFETNHKLLVGRNLIYLVHYVSSSLSTFSVFCSFFLALFLSCW